MSDSPPQGPSGGGSSVKWGWQLAVALTVLVVFMVIAVTLVINPGDANDGKWERRVYVFGSLEAIVFTAVGWIFGREVHRESAQQARDDAASAKDDAKTAQQEAKSKTEEAAKAETKGARLAAAVQMAEATSAGPLSTGPTIPGPSASGRSRDAGLSGGPDPGPPGVSNTPPLSALARLARELYPD